MCKMMVVDDEKAVREIMLKVLNQNGFPTVEAKSGEHALEVLKRHPAIRVVFIDLHMPVMDGMALCRILKKRDPALLVIAITGYSNVYTLIEARQAGFDDFCVKPLNIDFIREIGTMASKVVERWQMLK